MPNELSNITLHELDYDLYTSTKEKYQEINLDVYSQSAQPGTVAYEVVFPDQTFHYFIEISSGYGTPNPIMTFDNIDKIIISLTLIALGLALIFGFWELFFIFLLMFIIYHFAKSLFLDLEQKVYSALSSIFPNIPASWFPYITLLLLLLLAAGIYFGYKKLKKEF